jgi:hypothetical protein
MEKKIGFHYFQDLNHYQSRDLALWKPELESLQAGWLVMKASPSYAIPEEFISGLLDSGVQPVIHFDFPVNSEIRAEDLRILLSSYAKWGVKYVIFFDRPNMKSSWLNDTWSQGDLVERFLDRYLPFVRAAEQHGLVPVFPPLQPGGDYWDLSFLKKVLNLAKQRRSLDFVSNLHIAVSSQTFNHPLSWGAGGKRNWKVPRPYSKSEIGEEDHIGFNTWQWYSDLVNSILGVDPKMFLFYFGSSDIRSSVLDPKVTFEELIEFALSPSEEAGRAADQKNNILGCLFWILSSSEESQEGITAFFDVNGTPKVAEIPKYKEKLEHTRKQTLEYAVSDRLAAWIYPIDHYLLLPSYEWGIPENTLDRIRPIIRDSRPTIGFSLIEATNARKVTIWNENGAFSGHDIDILREAGCLIDEQIINSIGIPV